MPSKQMQSKSTPVIYAVELTKSYGDSLGISLDGKEPKITFGHWTIFDSLSLSLSQVRSIQVNLSLFQKSEREVWHTGWWVWSLYVMTPPLFN